MSYCRITVRQNVLTVIDRKPKPTELKILAKRESRLTYFQEKKKEVLQFDQQSKYKCIVMCETQHQGVEVSIDRNNSLANDDF